jgi:hypothetical protein
VLCITSAGDDNLVLMQGADSTFSWILVPASNNGSRQETLVKAFESMLSDEAQAKSAGLGFISLPATILASSRAALSRIKP